MGFPSFNKLLTGVVLVLIGGFLCYLQYYSSARLLVLSVRPAYGGDAASEISQLENVIRNVSAATIRHLGTVSADCKLKDFKTGSILLREFGNQSKEVWLILQLNPDRTVESGLIKVRVFYNSNKLLSTHFDLCKKFLPSIKCPIPAARQTYGLRYPLPRFVMPGNYGIEAWAVDQKDQTLACVNSEISL